tara:strand:- start:54 stop:785 length:732 start_codon:yes stop_codon:yes gene_type:complete
MIKLDIRSELPLGIKWTNEHTKQLPFSIAQALTAASKGIAQIPGSKNKSILEDLRRLAEQKLDRPKQQTSKGWFASTANKRTLTTVIKPKDKPWNRSRYFIGNIQGGDRPNKWIELQARRLGRLPSNLDLVPTYNIDRDKFGNPKRGQVKTLFKNVGTGKTFIGKPDNSTRPYGIYKVKGSGLEAKFVAKSSTNYPKPLASLEDKAYARARMVFGKYLRMRLEANVSNEVKLGTADLRVGIFR